MLTLNRLRSVISLGHKIKTNCELLIVKKTPLRLCGQIVVVLRKIFLSVNSQDYYKSCGCPHSDALNLVCVYVDEDKLESF